MKRARATQGARANVREFLQQESASAVVLVCATATALLWANLAPQSYSDVWSRAVRLGPANWRLDFELATWVADAVMAAFFFVVGLEIKRELTEGELSDPRVAAVPIAAACGGVVVPIVLFFLIAGTGDNSRGWAIPMATDIAFAQAALMLLGNRVERSARLFLLTLAIVDDILAITVIALFFGKHVSLTWLLAAVATVLGAVALRRARVAWMWPYLLVGAFGWYFTLRAGVHPTISAVAFGLLCPALDPRGRPLLDRLIHRVHPWSAFVALPLFAVSHAGITLNAATLSSMAGSSLTWGIVVGLVVGKPVGIWLGAATARRVGGRVAEDLTSRTILIVGALAGVGFTVALFVAPLALSGTDLERATGGVLLASIVAVVLGSVIARLPTSQATAPKSKPEPS